MQGIGKSLMLKVRRLKPLVLKKPLDVLPNIMQRFNTIIPPNLHFSAMLMNKDKGMKYGLKMHVAPKQNLTWLNSIT